MDPPTKSFNPNKLLKEDFVSNLTGSSMIELFMLLTMIPVLVVVRHSFSFIGRLEADKKMTSSKKSDDEAVSLQSWKIHTLMIAFDFLTLLLPIFVFLIVLAEWTYVQSVILMLVLIFSVISKRFGFSVEEESYLARTYISSYRVLMMLVTCLCILAVDFKVFPRRFAKVETYGTSLMDLGVGSFVFANALVSRQARGILTMSLGNALKSSSPLLFLGFARLVFTSGVDYQVHVGEYGVHWNFFFTLAAVSVLTSAFHFSQSYCGIIGFLILAGYQVCLMHGVNTYLLSDKRGTDIISQNKEGIFSIFGYWGMYMIGIQLGSYIFFGNSYKTNKGARIKVWTLSIVFWLLTLFLDCYVERVSRRMCNMAYVTLISASNLQVLAIIMLSGYTHGDKFTVLEEAFDKNLLALFLMANVLTGLVNLSLDTLSVSSVWAVCILISYLLVLSVVFGFANYSGIKFKFW